MPPFQSDSGLSAVCFISRFGLKMPGWISLTVGCQINTIPGKAGVFTCTVWIGKNAANDQWLDRIVGASQNTAKSMNYIQQRKAGLLTVLATLALMGAAAAPPPDGPYTGYFDSGEKSVEGTLKEGKRDGVWTFWNRQTFPFVQVVKSCQGSYVAGKQDGAWAGWNAAGIKVSEAHYRLGVLDGLETMWHPDGTKKREITYKAGQPETYRAWNEHGVLVGEGTYRAGKPWQGRFVSAKPVSNDHMVAVIRVYENGEETAVEEIPSK